MTGLTVATRDLKHAAAFVQASMDKGSRNLIPVLACAHAVPHANGQLITLAGTDLDQTAVIDLPCIAAGAGVPSPFLLSGPVALANALANGGAEAALTVTPVKDGADKLLAAAGALALAVDKRVRVDDWPVEYVQPINKLLSAPVGTAFLDALRRVVPAMSKEETRYYLNGVAMHHLDGWNFRLVATDGHRLHMADVALPGHEGAAETLPEGRPVIVPRRFVNTLLAQMRADDVPLELAFGISAVSGNQPRDTAPEAARAQNDCTRVQVAGLVKGMTARLVSKILDGTYPSYHRVIPTGDMGQAVLPVAELRRGINAVASGWATGSAKCTAMKMTFEGTGQDGSVTISMAFVDAGVTASYRFACQHQFAAGSVIGFRSGYVLDVLTGTGGDKVLLSVPVDFRGGIDGAAPTSWRNPDDADFHAVLMSMRV